MKLRMAFVTLLLVASSAPLHTAAQTRTKSALAPSDFIAVMAPVGKVAGSNSKIDVTVIALVTPAKSVMKVQIEDTGILGAKLEIAYEDLAAVAEALNQASEVAIRRGRSESEVGKTTVSAVQTDAGTSFVQIVVSSDGISFTSNKIKLDPDNAATLARLLDRGHRNLGWLEPRLSVLHFDSTLPMTIN